MDHEFGLNAYLKRGVGAEYVAILARELTAVEGIMQVTGAKDSEPFAFERGASNFKHCALILFNLQLLRLISYFGL